MGDRTMLCPFSKALCRDCAIFRGRHHYICSDGPRKSGQMLAWRETSGYRPDAPNRLKEIPKMPVLAKSPKWLSDLEDCIEGR
jgi:hypothetical protein